MSTLQEYPYGAPGEPYPDEDDMMPDLEPPRCCQCGHEIVTVPVLRLLSESDNDAEWSMCEVCFQYPPDYSKPWWAAQ